MDWSKIGSVFGYTFLLIILSGLVSYVLGYSVFVFLNC